MTFLVGTPGEPILAFCTRKSLKNHINKQLNHIHFQFLNENFPKKSIYWFFMSMLSRPTEIHVFEAFLRHFHFSTIINNFSTFWCWYFQPRKHFKKVENLRIYDPVFDSEKTKKNFFFEKSIFRRVVTGFFISIIFPESCIFLRWYFWPQKNLKKVDPHVRESQFTEHG